jgi:hypothetical protein
MAKREAKEKEEASAGSKTGWFISLDWFQRNNRSLAALIQVRLCPECAKKLGAKGNAASPETLISAVRNCCSRDASFINNQLPIMESAFRLFLANGNQPLELEELGRQLNQRRGGDPYRTAPEILLRLLKNDRYYGLQEIQG